MRLVDKIWADYFTSRIMMGRGAEPRELGIAALFLSLSDGSYLIGADLAVDGGFTGC
jgi:NAD(P)-dependent dehydrogenase (short-subunit alcohol dehydrogenase family)